MTNSANDQDPEETREWLDALISLIRVEGSERAQFILQQLLEMAEKQGVSISGSRALTTAYCNTIAKEEQPEYPGDLDLEAKLEALVRWNAIVMVINAKKKVGGVGGHLSSFASIATLYEVGLNHFFKGNEGKNLGDFVYFQGHSSEGNYARAYLEGRLDEEHLAHFRQEVDGKGVSSYPHPWLMPNFWQFATVSLGLGLLQGIYQARFLRYLENRKLLTTENRRVWVFCGDGEMDEPESIAGLTLAAREKLDNLVFIVNCNLQRLDGLVRGNGKIVQELEALFHGAGWNVIKVLWDSRWDELFEKDKTGILLKRLDECVDGDLQTAQVRGATYMREFLFNTAELQELVTDVSDEELLKFHRGAHDPIKVYAAYHAAVNHKNQPTVILTQGVKGYGLGVKNAEGRNIAHNQLDMSDEELKAFRDRFNLPFSDEELVQLNFYKPDNASAEIKYLHQQRKKLGGYLPSRHVEKNPLPIPDLSVFAQVLQGASDRPVSTTMVLGRILNTLLKDKNIGPRLVPIFSDEVRTFGLEALFRQVGIYSPVGQLYIPEDKEQFLYYHETTEGQVLEEGITEAGCMCSWIAAATSYANNDFPMIPFFTYYSMFGFQRVGDLIWAASDMRARGFLIGATAGRTTLEGEGLQHQDGNSLLTASTFPTCRAYDPAFGYEMAVIIQHGLDEMFSQEKDVLYYVMAMNEKYFHPALPEDNQKIVDGIIKGMYLFKEASKSKLKVQLFGSGAILNEVIAAGELLEKDFGIGADIWSVTSYSELQRDGLQIARKSILTPKKQKTNCYLQDCLADREGPIVAASDYVRALPELVRSYIDRTYITLGTDGFGRSDTRAKLRQFFEVNRYYIVLAALSALMQDDKIPASKVSEAIKKYEIDVDKPNPWKS